MDINKFTIKSQEALRKAQELALSHGNQQVDVLHLLYILISQEDSIVPVALRKLEADGEKIKEKLVKEIEKYPKAMLGPIGQVYITPLLAQILDQAEKEMAKLKDEFVSTEHIFLAILALPTFAKEIIGKNQLNYEKFLKVLSQVRGRQKVDSPSPEGKFQVIEKYAINLTKLAREDKLDPVIGRDEEIRRVMQVLSRRTKNNPPLIGEAGTGKHAIVEG